MEAALGALALFALFWVVAKTGAQERKSDRSQIQPRTAPSPLASPPPPARTPSEGKPPGPIVRLRDEPRQPPVRTPAIVAPRPKPFAFCAIDTETTGIVPRSRRHRAFEMSCVRFTPVTDVDWRKEFFTRYLTVDVRELRGLKLSPMWEGHSAGGGQAEAVAPAAALAELRDFVRDLPLVCHNAAFDRCVVENEIEKSAFPWSPKNRWICTLLMARSCRVGSFVGYSPGRDDGMSYKLEHVARALSIGLDERLLHFGHYDAEIAGNVFRELHIVRNVPTLECH